MANGDTLAIFLPLSNEPPTSNYATINIRNTQPVLAFDEANEEAAIFAGILPQQYSGGHIVVVITWLGATATSGSVVWNAQFERQDPATDVDSDSFASASSVAAATSATSGMPTYTELAFENTEIDGLQKGERFRLKITRDADDASDTMTGDAQLMAVELREE